MITGYFTLLHRRALLAILIASIPIHSVAHAATGTPKLGAAQSAAARSGVGSNYVIGPGDKLEVFVWQNPALTATVPVRPDGRITTPLVQDMLAVGKTPTQLSHDIEKVLSEYVRNPVVNVIVRKPASAYSQVKVIGQVKRPSAEPYRAGMKVLDAVLAAGGLTEFAAGNRAQIIRKANGRVVHIRIKLGKLMNDGDMKQNLPLRPGDVIVVPESRF